MNIKGLISLGVGAALVVPMMFFISRGQFTLAGALVALMFFLLIFRRPDLWWMVAVLMLVSGFGTGIRRLDIHTVSLLGFVALGGMQFIMTQGRSFHRRWSLPEKCILLMIAVVVGTAMVRGWGLRALGSANWGGWRYIILLGAFAFYLLANQVTLKERQLYRLAIGMIVLGILPAGFFLASLYLPPLNALHAFLPIREAGDEVQQMVGTIGATRLQPLQVPAMWAGMMALILYDRRHRFNPIIFLLASMSFVFMGLSGHRTVPVLLGLVLLSYLIFRRRFIPGSQYIGIVLVLVSALTAIYVVAELLPLPFQRALAILPGIQVTYDASTSAAGTTTWRIEMWRMMLPMIPQYLLIGRGMAFDLMEAYSVFTMASDIQRLQFFIVTHAYHSGPLFLLVDFGIVGFLAITFFMISSCIRFGRYRKQMPTGSKFSTVFTIFYSYYVANCIFYMAVIGSPESLARLMVIASLLEVTARAVRQQSPSAVNAVSQKQRAVGPYSSTLKSPVREPGSIPPLPAYSRRGFSTN